MGGSCKPVRVTREIETAAKCQMGLHKLSSQDYTPSPFLSLPPSSFFLSFEALLGDRHLFTFVIHTLTRSALLSVAVTARLSVYASLSPRF